MTPKELQKIFPPWYKKWLFFSLDLRDGEEISEKYLAPLFRLNKSWLEENTSHEAYSWNEHDVATSYALYYMTINIPKLWMVLGNSGVWRQRELKEIDSLVEFGCGPGTFLWSYLFYLRAMAPEQLQKIKQIRGIDISPTNVKIAEQLFSKLRVKKAFAHINAEFICGRWEDHISTSNCQLSIVGNSIIESSIDLTACQDQFSNLLVIEPGTLKHFQRLRILRNSFISQGWHIHFPCSGGCKCPMNADNWCHFHVNRFLLPFVQRMSSAGKRRNHRHNFSAFLFSRQENQLNKESWRILSPARKINRSVMRYICNGDKMFEAVLGRKARSEANKQFIDMEAGCTGQCSSRFPNKRLTENDTFSSIKF